MRFAGIHRAFVLGQAVDASNEALGAWLRLQSFASSDEIESERLEGARAWSSRRWFAACQLTEGEIAGVVGAGLARWEGDDLVLEGFDHEGLGRVDSKRENGVRFGHLGAQHGHLGGQFGKLGGRPRKEKPPQQGVIETPASPGIKPPQNPLPLPSSPSLSLPAEGEIAADGASPAAAVLVFPCNGKAKTWDLTEAWLAEARAAFPQLDVLADIRVALAKVNTGAVPRKTASGMPRFLMAWLSRTNDRAPATGARVPDPRCDWHRDFRNDARAAPQRQRSSNCPRCKHFGAAAGKREGPPVDIGELMAEQTRQLEERDARSRAEAAERFRQQRELDAGGST